MYREQPLERYVRDAAAGRPTPGGGSVSALAGALAASMGAMAANFTVGKKKFAAVEPRVKELLAEIEARMEELLVIMEDDVEAYSVVSAAYGKPSETPEQKAERTRAIQDALVVALEPPLRAMRAIARVIQVADELCEIANPNLISDVGVCAAISSGALIGARLNVEINLAGLKDAEFVQKVRTEVDALMSGLATAQTIVEKVQNRMKPH